MKECAQGMTCTGGEERYSRGCLWMQEIDTHIRVKCTPLYSASRRPKSYFSPLEKVRGGKGEE